MPISYGCRKVQWVFALATMAALSATVCVNAQTVPWVYLNNSEAVNEGIAVTTTGTNPAPTNVAVVGFLCQAEIEPQDGEESQAGAGIYHKTYHLTVRHREQNGITNILDLNHGQIVGLDIEDSPGDECLDKWKHFDMTGGGITVHRCLYNVAWLDTRTVFVWQEKHVVTEPAEHESPDEVCETRGKCPAHKRILHRFRVYVQFQNGGKYWVTCRAGKYMEGMNIGTDRTFLEPQMFDDNVPNYGEWLEAWSGYSYEGRWPCDPFKTTDGKLLSGACRTELHAYQIEDLKVIPYGMSETDVLPDPVAIGVGGVGSAADMADVKIRVSPALSGLAVPVRLENGLGHEPGRTAKLVLPLSGAGVTAYGGGPSVLGYADSDGMIFGSLTASDVLTDGETVPHCIVHAGLAEKTVRFSWDEFREDTQWVTDLGYLPVPGTLLNTLTLRHHRLAEFDEELPAQPFMSHDLRFFVTKVEFWDGTPDALNDPPWDDGLSEYATFPLTKYTTDGFGRVADVPLTVKDNDNVKSITMSVYDWTVWLEPATPLATFALRALGAATLPAVSGTPESASHVSDKDPNAILKVDIEQDMLSTCSCTNSLTLTLTSDSHPGSGTTWSSDPATGLAGVITTDSTYEFDPSLSTPGKYVITAASQDLSARKDTSTVYIARLSLNDIKAIRYNKEHRGDVCSDSANQITLTIEGDLGPSKEAYVGGNLMVRFADPADPGGLLDSRNVTETTTFDLVPSSVSDAAADRKVQAGLVDLGGGILEVDHFCAEDKFISYAYYVSGFTGVVLQCKDTTNHCDGCEIWFGVGDPPSTNHTGLIGKTQPHPHDANWSACHHCNNNCARAVVVMLGLAATQDSVMKQSTTTLTANHGQGMSGEDLEDAYGLDVKLASSFMTCYRGIRENDALGSRPTTTGTHGHLVDGAKKNDAAGNITDIKYHGADPGDGDIEWRDDFTTIMLQP